jgi:hypothetical protein
MEAFLHHWLAYVWGIESMKKKEGKHVEDPRDLGWGLMDLCCYEWSIEISEKNDV